MADGDYGVQMPIIDEVPLRQCALAVSVMADIDLTPTAEGVLLPGSAVPGGHQSGSGQSGAESPGDVPVLVGWEAIQDAVGTYPSHGEVARRRLQALLRLHRLAADFGPAAVQRFNNAARVVALPPGHTEHPGAGWVQQPLPGGTLDLGIGVQGLAGDPDKATPLPPSVLRAIGVEPTDWWPALREHAERMGALSAARLVRGGSTGLIRPVGGCDVLALLSSRSLRRHLADVDSTGMRALAVPTRRRGWFDDSQIDPAFVRAAWSLTDDHERGLPVPLLVTADEVTRPRNL